MSLNKVTIIILFLSNAFCFGQIKKYNFTSHTIKSSLSANYIFEISQDTSGIIWVGSYNGLYSYDGYDFKLYWNNIDDKNLILNNYVTVVCEDSKGRFYVGTCGGGLFMLDKFFGKYTQIELYDINKKRININCIKSITELKDKSLCIGHTGKDLLLVDSTRTITTSLNFDTIQTSNNEQMYVKPILQSKLGNIWIGTSRCLIRVNNLKTLSGYKKYILHNTPINDNNSIETIYEDNNGIIWIGTFGGLFRYDAVVDSFINVTETMGIKNLQVTKIIKYTDNQIAFSSTSGLFIQNNGKLSFTPYKNDFVENQRLYNIFKDKAGNIWTGGGSGLLYKSEFKTRSFEITNTKNLIKPNKNIFIDSDNNYWVNEYKTGLCKINLEKNIKQTLKFKGENFSENVNYIYQCDTNLLILANHLGIFSIHKNNLQIQQISKTPIKGLFFEGKKVFFETKEILYEFLFNEEKSELIPYLPLNNGIVLEMINEKVLYYTNKKIVVYDKKTNTTIENNRELTFNAFVRDEKNKRIWLSNINFFTKLEYDENFNLNYIPVNIPINIELYPISTDKHGNLWTNNIKGIVKISNLNDSIEWFDNQDGIDEKLYTTKIVSPFTQKLYFLTPNNLISFNPDSLKLNSYEGKTLITDIFVGYSSYKEILRDSSKHEISFNENEVTLPYYNNYVSFQFALTSFTAPNKNKFIFILENYDKQWSAPNDNKMVNYRNLPPGEYIFKVFGINNSGLRSKYPAVFKLIITPPFWKTKLAYFFYLILTIFLLYFIRQWLFKVEKDKNLLKIKSIEAANALQLSQKEKEYIIKEKEIDDKIIRFFTNISHELRTPLTLIVGPIQRLLSNDNFQQEKKLNFYKTIETNAMRLIRMVDQLLDFRKIQEGKMELQISYDDIIQFIQKICTNFKETASNLNIELQLHSNTAYFYAGYDPDKLEKIIYNLISNALKFTPSKGKIGVDLQISEIQNIDKKFTELILQVSDNGIGIEKDMQENIFKPFYQVKSDINIQNQGSGIGLSYVNELVNLYQGEISVKSELNIGTTFTVKIPLVFSSKSEVIISDNTNNLEVSIHEKIEDFHIVESIDATSTNTDEKVSILVVEDNQELRTFLKTELEDAGYVVYITGNGKEGIDMATEQLPQLIISDIMMPKMDGIEFCKQIRNTMKTSHIPIIFLTAKTSISDILEGLKAGADDYIIKPFNAIVLIARVNAIIDTYKRLRKRFSKEIVSIPLNQLAKSSIDQLFMHTFISIIELNIANKDLDVDFLASEMKMSRSQLYRKLQNITNESTIDFIRSIRLKKAAQLLIEGHKVQDVSELVGFATQSYFSKSFAKFYGLAPSEYANQYSVTLAYKK